MKGEKRTTGVTQIAEVAEPVCEYRVATDGDIGALIAIEERCFSGDRLSRRSFKRWLHSSHGIMLVAQGQSGALLGYGLVWCHRGTRLARLYSLAVLPIARGQGIARELLMALERSVLELGRLYMRLEVAKSNLAAQQLYERSGYRVFGEYSDYYDDHSDALRMQKTIVHFQPPQTQRFTPWYQQTTEFSCGPAALMMAMASLMPELALEQALELDLWREATTIFMTSGHGGCHPVGLALSARRRGFEAMVYLNSREPLFVDGVRSNKKKQIMEVVHHHFMEQASEQGVEVVFDEISQQQIASWIEQGYAVLMLISTYRLDGRKAPHWVTVTSIDERCLYVHDPDPDEPFQLAIDCQYLPIARADFDKMSAFGSGRLRTAVAIRLR